MKKNIICIFFVIIAINLFAQKTIISDNDILLNNNSWKLNPNHIDGTWVLCRDGDTNKVIEEATYINGLKNGREINNWNYEECKIVSNYVNGKKEGIETHYNRNRGVLEVRFENGKLNGLVNCFDIDGKLLFSGYYKQNIKDSIWSYYNNTQELVTEKKYSDGKVYLINAWDRKRNQIVKNGSGLMYDEFYNEKDTIRYKDGLKNGLAKEGYNAILYENDLPIEITDFGYSDSIGSFFSKSKKSSYKYILKNGNYDFVADRDLTFSDCYGLDERVKTLKYDTIKNGIWQAWYSDGKLVYDGNYKEDKRIGVWKCYFSNGSMRSFVDYTNNKSKHYNENGTILSENFQEEYFSYLINTSFFNIYIGKKYEEPSWAEINDSIYFNEIISDLRIYAQKNDTIVFNTDHQSIISVGFDPSGFFYIMIPYMDIFILYNGKWNLSLDNLVLEFDDAYIKKEILNFKILKTENDKIFLKLTNK